MLFYFAPAKYLYLFMIPPQESWVSQRLLLRAVISLSHMEHNGPMLPVTDLQTLTMKYSSEEVSISAQDLEKSTGSDHNYGKGRLIYLKTKWTAGWSLF